MEVRQTFGSKVQRTLLTLYNQPASHNKAAKYAAVLSLAGMDPATANQQAALACLQQFAAVRRQAAQLVSRFAPDNASSPYYSALTVRATSWSATYWNVVYVSTAS